MHKALPYVVDEFDHSVFYEFLVFSRGILNCTHEFYPCHQVV